MAMNIVEIAGIKRFSHGGNIYIVEEDFADLLVVKNQGNLYLKFEGIDYFYPIDDFNAKIKSVGRNINFSGINFEKRYYDSENKELVSRINGKTVYFKVQSNRLLSVQVAQMS